MPSAHETALATQKRRTAFAWAKYYEEMENTLANDTAQFYLNNRVVENHSDSFPEHIKKELEENLIALKRKIECPVCLEVIEQGQLDITNCGHKYCKTCLGKLKQTTKKCALCRKKVCR